MKNPAEPSAGPKRKHRTYRIVGTQRQIDERETPHFRVERGELGERLRLRRKTRSGRDALRRTFGGGGEMKGDQNNSLRHVIRRAPQGAVNPDRKPVTDPDTMAHRIKEVARFFGADVVGITHLDRAYVYSHRARGSPADNEKPGEPIHLSHKYAICMGVSGDYNRFMTNNSQISNLEYVSHHHRTIVPSFMLAAYIREMGYPARYHAPNYRWELIPIPLAVNAGLGELGRNGLLINEVYGSRLGLSVVTTDLPLKVDEPVDIGVEDVCKLCLKCARNCPSYSIGFGNKVVVNGVEKWAINVDSCYKYKLASRGQWSICTICVSACCYNKRKAWWHTLAVWLLKQVPIPLRPFYIRPLLWIDDLIWGKKPWRRMMWLGYDNAPAPVTCHIPGCIANHEPRQNKRIHVPNPGLKDT